MLTFYTMTLREICEQLTGKTTTSEVIPAAAPLLFNFPITFYDPEKLTQFEQAWIRNFFMREIGLETVDYFLLRLQDKFDTILPYYNQLFSAAAKEFDPFVNEIISEKIEYSKDNTKTTNGTDKTSTTSNGKTESESNTSGNSSNQYTESQYPQGQLDNFEDNSYLTSANKNSSTDQSDSTGTSTSESTGSGTLNTNRTETDNGTTTENRTASNTKGDQSEMLRKYYESVQNITQRFYKDCEDLFMQLWL